MKSDRHEWALVLAAGEGTRLRALTTGPDGVAVPKQFCRIGGETSLLQTALRRAERVVPPERTLVVVAAHHRRWWERDLAALAAGNLVVQPRNRGTAAGVLLPLLEILRRDPQARVLVLPSDHFVGAEGVLAGSARQAFAETERFPEKVMLLGIAPDSADAEYGWISPGRTVGEGLFEVSAFVEKPERETAGLLRRRGGVWNSFIFVARGRTLMRLYERRLPGLVRGLSGAVADRNSGVRRMSRISAVYDHLPVHDFSGDLLQGSEEALRLLPVPACGWSDLGTPDRVSSCLGSASLTPGPRVANAVVRRKGEPAVVTL
jgi:mannose-1-phosphate guanylyltransferase